MEFLKRNFLFFIVFITGAAILIIEITATRILAPFFGNTLFTVSSIIGIVLGALSLGYYFGGIFSDKHPHFSFFFFLIFVGGVCSLLIQLFSKTILPVLGYSLGMKIGPPIASLILFTPPSFILGMMSPFAIKLKTLELKEVGKISGKVFFWSTLGSIFGSFLAGFFLIPRWGVDNIIISTGSILIIIGILGFFFSKDKVKSSLKKPKFFLFLIVLLLLILASSSNPKSVIFQKDGLYSQIKVKERKINDREGRVLRLDRALSGGVFLESDELPFAFAKYYNLYKIANPGAKRALFLGGGTYSMPRKILLEDNIKRVDVVEIEPELYQIAKKYFKLQEDPRLFNHITDGRRFLQETDQEYDLIFSDVYRSVYSIPIHFTTKEFFGLAKKNLSKNGIFLINVIGTLEEDSNKLLLSEMKTFQSVFKNSYFFAVDSPDKKELQNFIFLGLNNESKKLNFSSKEILENKNRTIRNLPKKVVNPENLNLKSALIFTDNFAPIEYFTAKLF